MKKLLLLWLFFLQLHLTNAQTVSPAGLHNMEAAIENGTYPNIHSILIAHNNKIIYEKYWSGEDAIWGKKLGIIAHTKDSLHDERSVSKSVVSACIGIAVDQGKIKSINEKIFDFFPEYTAQDTGLKSQITIKDLLTMTAGFQWDEDTYGSPQNNETKMEEAQDPVGYVLSQPMAFAPGKVWRYNGGATQLLASIIQKATGKSISTFAGEYLFSPLGITRFEWTKYSADGIPAAASGLRLLPRDLLKFGLLYMNDGKWNSKQIITAGWINESFTQYFPVDTSGTGYGFQWWLWTDTIMNKPTPIAACIGNGGQRVFVDKLNDIVVVFNAGNYNTYTTRPDPYNILMKFIYPAVFGEK